MKETILNTKPINFLILLFGGHALLVIASLFPHGYEEWKHCLLTSIFFSFGGWVFYSTWLWKAAQHFRTNAGSHNNMTFIFFKWHYLIMIILGPCIPIDLVITTLEGFSYPDNSSYTSFYIILVTFAYAKLTMSYCLAKMYLEREFSLDNRTRKIILMTSLFFFLIIGIWVIQPNLSQHHPPMEND